MIYNRTIVFREGIFLRKYLENGEIIGIFFLN